MIARLITLMATFLFLVPDAPAGLTEEMADLPTCTLYLRVIKGPAEAAGPRFIMMDGVPLSGAVFKHVAERLSERLNATSALECPRFR